VLALSLNYNVNIAAALGTITFVRRVFHLLIFSPLLINMLVAALLLGLDPFLSSLFPMSPRYMSVPSRVQSHPSNCASFHTGCLRSFFYRPLDKLGHQLCRWCNVPTFPKLPCRSGRPVGRERILCVHLFANHMFGGILQVFLNLCTLYPIEI
jgi:hypothetical protein